MPDVKTVSRFGWLPELPDRRDFLYSSLQKVGDEPKVAALPLVVDLRPKLAHEDVRVFDQGYLGSCVANAVSTMIQFERNLAPRSRLQIYYEARKLIGFEAFDSGCYIRDAIKVVNSLGAGREVWWPYDPTKFDEDPPATVDRDASKRKILTYMRLENGNDFRQCLAAGHVFVIGFSVYSNFMGALAENWGLCTLPNYRRDSMEGGHAITVIGYHDEFRSTQWAEQCLSAGLAPSAIPERVYYCRNSWGVDWGRDGDFAIDARYLEDAYLADDAWTIRA